MALKDKISGLFQGLIENLGEKVVLELVKKFLTTENVKAVLDAIIDKLEDLIAKTNTDLDDKLVLPVLTALRNSLNIPDND